MTLQLKIKINDHVTEDENDTDVQDDKIWNPNSYELKHMESQKTGQMRKHMESYQTNKSIHRVISDR